MRTAMILLMGLTLWACETKQPAVATDCDPAIYHQVIKVRDAKRHSREMFNKMREGDCGYAEWDAATDAQYEAERELERMLNQ